VLDSVTSPTTMHRARRVTGRWRVAMWRHNISSIEGHRGPIRVRANARARARAAPGKSNRAQSQPEYRSEP
jgi:hypothetical protein